MTFFRRPENRISRNLWVLIVCFIYSTSVSLRNFQDFVKKRLVPQSRETGGARLRWGEAPRRGAWAWYRSRPGSFDVPELLYLPAASHDKIDTLSLLHIVVVIIYAISQLPATGSFKLRIRCAPRPPNTLRKNYDSHRIPLPHPVAGYRSRSCVHKGGGLQGCDLQQL